jgi:hypothetical protein
MMNMVKMKVVDKFEAIKAMLNGEKVEGFTLADALEFLDGRIEQTEKKNASGANGERKPTKTQLENEGVKVKIADVLREAGKPMSVSEITKQIGIESTNKTTALVSQMLVARKGIPNPNGCVKRTEVKGKAYFEYAPTSVEE